jgi:hypothetical protein
VRAVELCTEGDKFFISSVFVYVVNSELFIRAEVRGSALKLPFTKRHSTHPPPRCICATYVKTLDF